MITKVNIINYYELIVSKIRIPWHSTEILYNK